MNKITKKRLGLKRKEQFNKKLALQIVFSIILVAAVIFTKEFNTSFSRQFIDATEEKVSKSIDLATIKDTFSNFVSTVRSKIPFLSKEDSEFAAPVIGTIHQGYGLNNSEEASFYNHGVDILSKTKTIKSISKGTVSVVGNNEKLSNYVVIEEEDKTIIYGNIEEALVGEGDSVSKGDIIGALSEENKILHLEVWEDGESLNPSKLFKLVD